MLWFLKLSLNNENAHFMRFVVECYARTLTALSIFSASDFLDCVPYAVSVDQTPQEQNSRVTSCAACSSLVPRHGTQPP